MRVVKSFNGQAYEIDKFHRISNSIYNDFTKAERYIALNSPLMQFFMYVCMILISWIGAKAIVASGNNEMLGLTTGELTALFTYAMQVLMSLMMLSMVLVMITIARSSGERIAEVLNEKTDITNPENPVTEVKNGEIRYENVDFVYASKVDKKVISNASLTIRSGETIGIIGGTGSSKTSLVQLIPRLYDVTGGSVFVGGIDVRRYDLNVLRNAVAMVLQKNELFSGTIKENLRYGNRNATDEECIAAAKLANAHNFIMMLPEGYQTVLNGDGSGLSQGQRQLISIARAAVANPPVMILDEATSSIDTRTEALVQKGMDRLMEGRTVFIIAHRLSTVMNSDVIMVLDHGRIMERGSHDELIANKGMYYRLYTGAFEPE